MMVGVGTGVLSGVSSGEGTEGRSVGPLLASVVGLLVGSNSVFPVVGCKVTVSSVTILAQLVVNWLSEHAAETVYVD